MTSRRNRNNNSYLGRLAVADLDRASTPGVEHVRVTIEDAYVDPSDPIRYRVVRHWRLGVCSGYQICGEFDRLSDAERRATHVRNGGDW